jgi:hypothetical protein
VRIRKSLIAAAVVGGVVGGVALAGPANAAVVRKTGCKIRTTGVTCTSPDSVRANAAHQLRVCAKGGIVIGATIVVGQVGGGKVHEFTTWRQRCDVLSNLRGEYRMFVTGGGEGWIQDY